MEEEQTAENIKQGLPIVRAESVNDSERYLKKLCDRSFLSLWSYSSVFKDQGRGGKGGDGKEICDLLVVFGNHVLIFSDKYCEIKDTGNLETDWNRWYRHAVLNSAKQVYGAERWLKQQPDNVYLDRKCTQPFPINLPDPAIAQYHRIIVAHGASERCRKHLGGSGSLIIVGNTDSDIHTEAVAGKQPFTIGQINPAKGFVHIFDDTTLDIVLKTLDTASDFIAYLTKKEAFVTSERFLSAAGEEELLAKYLERRNEQEAHDFVFPNNPNLIALNEGWWKAFKNSPQREAQIEANKISYEWDKLIEEFTKQNMNCTVKHTNFTLQELEPGIRLMAAENRTRRRMLWEEFSNTRTGVLKHKAYSTVIFNEELGKSAYVFLEWPQSSKYTYKVNHNARRNCLIQHGLVVKAKYPNVQDVLGIAKEPGLPIQGTINLVYQDMREWTEENQARALELQKASNLLSNTDLQLLTAEEYPVANSSWHQIFNPLQQPRKPYQNKQKPGPNKPCPCGSNIKYKRCCGR